MSDKLKNRRPKSTQHSALSTQHSALSTQHSALSTQHFARTGTVLAFDFGAQRIGVAVGDFELRIAHPLTTVAVADNRARFTAIERLIAEWRPILLVVGQPSRADGTEHPVGRLARRFAQRLQGRFGLRAELVDEHLTSHDAEHSLRSAGARGARVKAGLDAVAAQRILEAYFVSVTGDS